MTISIEYRLVGDNTNKPQYKYQIFQSVPCILAAVRSSHTSAIRLSYIFLGLGKSVFNDYF